MTPALREMASADVPIVVDLHLRAFPGFFLSALGAPFLRVYYRNVLRDGGSIALVAEDASGLEGFVVGSVDPAGFYGRLLRRRWYAFALAAVPGVLRHPSVAGRVARALRHPSESRAGVRVAGVYSLAVDPLRWGSGVGRALVDRFCALAHARGATQVFLETDAEGNERVNRFYAATGFTETGRRKTPEGRVLVDYVRVLDAEAGGPDDG